MAFEDNACDMWRMIIMCVFFKSKMQVMKTVYAALLSGSFSPLVPEIKHCRGMKIQYGYVFQPCNLHSLVHTKAVVFLVKSRTEWSIEEFNQQH